MDALSEVLKIVKLDSAFFHNAEFSAPWSFSSPNSRRLAPHINQSSGHVIIYHFLIEGTAHARLGDERLEVLPGDVVIFPHGDPHFLESGTGAQALDVESELQRIFSQGLSLSRFGGGGELTRFVCGFLVCEPNLSQVFLAGLPSMFKINIREEPSGQWIENSIRHSMADPDSRDPSTEAVLARLAEALFMETLRRYVSLLPPNQTGWLAGAHDAEVGKVLAQIHRQPEVRWTIADLAHEAGLSRSVLAQRFRHYVGLPPVAYLTRWRLQLGAQMLSSTDHSVAQIAAKVGYDSEQSFNRAFKRTFGSPPARYRVEKNQRRSRALL